jgi:hypothetical protein
METRRIRRLERRRVHRILGLACAVSALGVAVGMSLPRSTPVSVALFALAACALVTVALRDESIAPLHGLHRVMRLPLRQSLAATIASFGSRIAGTARGLVSRRPELTPIVLDEPDDEAEAWWGRAAASAPAPTLAAQPRPVEPVEAAVTVEPVDPVSPAPVLAAPLPSAHVATDGSERAPGWAAHVSTDGSERAPGWAAKLRAGIRRRGGALAQRMEPTEEVGAST